jgi:hypothetical protein
VIPLNGNKIHISKKIKSILIGAPSKYSKNMLLWFFFENGRNTILGTFENKIQSKPFKNP